MRGWCALLFALVPALLHAQEAATLHIERADPRSLERALVELAQHILAPGGVIVEREHVSLDLSAALPASGDVEARAAWSAAAGVPALPLVFELRPRGSSRAAPPVRAILKVRVQRQVEVAQRRLRKGSYLSCADFALQPRGLDDPRHGTWLTTCPDQADAAALRDIAAGEALRAGDVGKLPDVLLGAPVQLSASNGGITVTTLATALADARIGDPLDVRVQRPTRTLRTRVVARGVAQLLDEAP